MAAEYSFRQKLTKPVKQQIIADWQAAFPWLGVLSSESIAIRYGPTVFALTLAPTFAADAYRPTWHLHVLGRGHVDLSLSMAVPLRSRRTKARVSIRPCDHAREFEDAVTRMRESCPVAENMEQRWSDVRAIYLARAPKEPTADHAYTDLIAIRVWCGDLEDARRLFRRTRRRLHWMRTYRGEKDILVKWEDEVANMLRDPDGLRTRVEKEAAALRLERVPAGRFICEE